MKLVISLLIIFIVNTSSAQIKQEIDGSNFVVYYTSGEVKKIEHVEVHLRGVEVEICYFDGVEAEEDNISRITFDRDGKTISARLYQIDKGFGLNKFMFVLNESKTAGLYKSVFSNYQYFFHKKSKDSKKIPGTKVLTRLAWQRQFINSLGCDDVSTKYYKSAKATSLNESDLIECITFYSENCED